MDDGASIMRILEDVGLLHNPTVDRDLCPTCTAADKIIKLFEPVEEEKKCKASGIMNNSGDVFCSDGDRCPVHGEKPQEIEELRASDLSVEEIGGIVLFDFDACMALSDKLKEVIKAVNQLRKGK